MIPPAPAAGSDATAAREAAAVDERLIRRAADDVKASQEREKALIQTLTKPGSVPN